MSYSDPTKLGIIACPGAEVFADNVVRKLSGIYKRRFDRKTQALSSRYHISQELAIRKINFSNDANSGYLFMPGPTDKYRPPRFKINARHTFFANGEIKTEILESIRGKDIYIFQDIENHQPIAFNEGAVKRVMSVNDHIFNLFVAIDSAMQAGAERINLVLPMYPYSRQHKKKGREGLTAARVGAMLENLGADRIITLDIHSREIENCFDKLRLENLHASFQIIEKLMSIVDIQTENLVVLAPDTGAVDRNKFYANALQRPLALLYKERDYSKVSKNASESNISEMRLLGDVEGKTIFMADDMIGTGGTLIKGMKSLKDLGASKVICAVSLPLFNGTAIDDFDAAYRQGYFYRIIGTNAVYQDELLRREWYIQADVTGLFAQIISLIHHDRSLSSLLDNRDLVAKLIKKQMEKGKAKQGNLGFAAKPGAEQEIPIPPEEVIPYGAADKP
ncbi:MAG: ribose-phosphate diphosphokinase [Spirochaetales bacterium]|jgi:ribose-phosphate pyrophosphokinase|uniref:ribose-phosphate diphosphokinase n=1 Tax=uncultured Spirochaetota bacterium TaxID=460511 RepID=A0A652ZTF6_9SPIR|nr:ribose-phosphate diphosphokinase [Spirochaetales bacterium]NLX44666.1 ribose-phosphate diphosphokinase [Treponema sp.]VBB39058.1 Ribose-phosphate pyrophosphokinase [uncultured Spirochaetota bacterium]HOI22491.1 ribose-phosphate diphosphokinase [Spirochaetales bacterium]